MRREPDRDSSSPVRFPGLVEVIQAALFRAKDKVSKEQLEAVQAELPVICNAHMLTDIVQCQVEEAALSKEKDKVSKDRLEEVRREVAALQDELRPLLTRYNKERERLQELRRLRKKKEELQARALSLSQAPSSPL